MEAERKRALEQAEQVEKDMRAIARIVLKYKLLVVAPEDSYRPPNTDGINRAAFSRAQEEAEAVIRSAGHPVLIGELFHILLERGIILGAKESNALSSALIRSPRLKFIPKLGWWLREVSWPPKPEEIGLISNPPSQEEENGPRKRGRRTPEKEKLYQALREFLDGRKEPVPFKEIYEHIQQLGLPLSGQDPKQNLSAFMSSIHEFRAHGPTGRAGWTFSADDDWSVVEGFKADDDDAPSWYHNPVKQKLFEAVRNILKTQTERVKFGDLFAQVKELGVSFGGVKNEENYLANLLSTVPCFQSHKKDASGKGGWRYVPELDETAKKAGTK
jgi:hypothetical protein